MNNPEVMEYKLSPSGRTSRNKAGHLFAGTLVVVVLALYMSFIFNRNLPINEGWFYYYSWLMHKGQMPYRDFWYFTQPYSVIVSWLFAGDHLINLRIYGLVERIALSGMLYFLLSRQFSPKASFLSTLVSMIVLLNYPTEGFFTFLIDSLTFFVAGLICVYEAQNRPHRENWLLVLAGVCGSMSFFSKQSTGLFTTLALVILIAWPHFKFSGLVRKLLYFSVGWCIPAVSFVTWLAVNGAWHAYVFQVFKGAAQSKGSLTTILFATVQRTLLPKDLGLFFLILALLGIAVWKRHLLLARARQTDATKADIVLTALLALIVIFVPVLHPIIDERKLDWMRRGVLLLGKLIFIAMLAQTIWLVVRRLRSHTSMAGPVTAILVIGGLFWAYGAQLSYRVEQHAVVLGLAYLVAAACDSVSSRSGKSFVGIITVLCLIQVGVIAIYKYSDAYDWNGWRSVIALSYTKTSHWPQLAGFKMDGETAYMFDRILDDIAKDTKPGEPIFTFPAIPMFNFITGHPQPTFAPVHYWDVCPDAIAEADTARVRAAKPAVIVEMDLPEWQWQIVEVAFRNGKRSAQRDMEALIQEFVDSGDYRLQDTFLTPWTHTPVNVWQRVR